MNLVKFTADKEFTHNFKTIINGVAVTVVVADGDKFNKGDVIELEAKKRSTGDGFYLIRASKLENIKLEAIVVDTTKIIDNKLDTASLLM